MDIKRYGTKKQNSPDRSKLLATAVEAGGFFFVSGQVPTDAEDNVIPGGIEKQARIVIEKIQNVLKAHELSLANVVKVNAWLVSKDDFPIFNRVYAEYFLPHQPVRSTVQSVLMIDAKIEMDVIAFRG